MRDIRLIYRKIAYLRALFSPFLCGRGFFKKKSATKNYFFAIFSFILFVHIGGILIPLQANSFDVVILLGPPGSGKGSQASWIAERFGIKHLSTGDLFRDAARDDPIISDILKKGALVSDQQVCDLVKKELDRLKGTPGVLFDGFPRSLQQAKWLDSIIGQSTVTVLLLDTPDALLFSRVAQRFFCPTCKKVYRLKTAPSQQGSYCSCGGKLIQRSDDQDVTVFKRRIEEYHKTTKPLMDYYKKRKQLIVIDGSRSIQQVKDEIEGRLFKEKSS